MDELFFGTEKFISSKRASKLTGYTTDYVGQLCRAEKIKSKLVGRNWYVNEISLLEHKQGPKKDQTTNGKELSQYAYEPLQYVADERSRYVKVEKHDKSAVLNYKSDDGSLNPRPQKPITSSGVRVLKTEVQKKVSVRKKILSTEKRGFVIEESKTRFSNLPRKTVFPNFLKFGIGTLVVAALAVGFLITESTTSYFATETGGETTASRIQLADVFAVFD